MSTDSQSVRHIALEVAVPLIELPGAPSSSAPSDSETRAEEESEQVSLLAAPARNRGRGRDRQPAQTIAAAATITTHAATKKLFHLFRLKIVPSPGQRYLLRIWHPQALHGDPLPQRTQHLPSSDDMAFTVAYSTASNDTATQRSHPPLIPGQNQVVIILDEEGIPATYRIDGAEG